MLEVGPFWVKLKHHKWKRPRGFTTRVLFNKTNKQKAEGWTRWNRLKSFKVKGTLVSDSVQPHGQPIPHEITTVEFSSKIATPPRHSLAKK